MGLYTKIPCVSCNQPFSENDDVVVCPVCGAPHHRSCFAQNNRCALYHKHTPNFVWKADSALEQHHPVEHNHVVNAPLNYSDSQCEGINGQTEQKSQSPKNSLNAADNVLNHISDTEMNTYIGPNAAYFMHQFRMMHRSSRFFTWNWPAFFLESLYFFYRKMYGIGAALMVLVAVFNLPGVLLSIETLFLEHPDMFKGSLGYSENTLHLLEILSNVGFILYFSCRVACGYFANRIYKEKTIREIVEIKQLRDEFGSEHAFLSALFQRGRPSILSVVLALFVQFTIVSTLSRIFL